VPDAKNSALSIALTRLQQTRPHAKKSLKGEENHVDQKSIEHRIALKRRRHQHEIIRGGGVVGPKQDEGKGRAEFKSTLAGRGLDSETEIREESEKVS